MVFSVGYDYNFYTWSIPNQQLKHEFFHFDPVYDLVIGRQGTPLQSQIVSLGRDKCRVFNFESGTEVKRQGSTKNDNKWQKTVVSIRHDDKK